MAVSEKTVDEIDNAKELENLKILEAVFFVSGRFLNMQDLISLSDLNPIIIRDLIEKLKEKYENENSALEIVQKKGMWKMDVRQEYSHIINKLATGNAEFTKAEQETLAIIAYKQPIKQSVIIKIRGNKSYDHIKKFSDLGLIKKKKMGHTNELTLSDEFYDYFNVADGEAQGKKVFEESGFSDEDLADDENAEDSEEEKEEVVEY
jgi:segregation and condensation protein B